VNPSLIDAVGIATSHRDRDELDEAVAQLLFDHVHPTRVRVYRVIDFQGGLRVQLRVTRDAAGVVHAEGLEDPAQCPRITERAHWHECALLGDAVHYIPEDDLEAEGEFDAERFDSIFPLMGARGPIGLVEIEYSGEQAAMRPHDAGLVQGVLRILRNHVSALEYGERDTLTGLLNRRTFETTFAKRRAGFAGQRAGTVSADGGQAGPGQVGNWLAVIDIDRFKNINDSYGHLFGDEVLLLVARLMFESFRSTELIYRFGGEEFVVVVDDANESGAEVAYERFRRTVAEHRFPQIGQVTVSIGYTRLRPEDIPASPVERADAALYFAKDHGRNQIACYESLLRDGKLSAARSSGPELELF
jgi:diguanylate cyclase (GGDEF)-like protein